MWVNQRPCGGLTSVELWSVVVGRVLHLTEEGGQVPTDCYWEHQCHTDPEWTYTHTHGTHKRHTHYYTWWLSVTALGQCQILPSLPVPSSDAYCGGESGQSSHTKKQLTRDGQRFSVHQDFDAHRGDAPNTTMWRRCFTPTPKFLLTGLEKVISAVLQST